MKIHDLPNHKRPREKLFEKGAEALSEAELLAILLRSGYQGKNAVEVAQRLLSQHRLAELVTLPLTQLARLKGVGLTRASLIKAAFTLMNQPSADSTLPVITTPQMVYQLVHRLHHKKQEHLVCLYLNARNQLISQEVITIGTLNSSLLHPREIFAPAIHHRAASIVLVHNHPSGDTTPSEEDIISSEKILEAGQILDIPLLDHVIVSNQGWKSLKQEQLI